MRRSVSALRAGFQRLSLSLTSFNCRWLRGRRSMVPVLIYCGSTLPLAVRFVEANRAVYRRVRVRTLYLLPAAAPLLLWLAMLSTGLTEAALWLQVTADPGFAREYALGEPLDWPSEEEPAAAAAPFTALVSDAAPASVEVSSYDKWV